MPPTLYHVNNSYIRPVILYMVDTGKGGWRGAGFNTIEAAQAFEDALVRHLGIGVQQNLFDLSESKPEAFSEPSRSVFG